MFGTIKAKDATVWVNYSARQVYVSDSEGRPSGDWCDPIGAAYSSWFDASNKFRVMLMQETVIELASLGFAMEDVMIEFCKVKEYFDLGRKSWPMCRAITLALTGKCVEASGKEFDDRLIEFGRYVPKRIKAHNQRLAPVLGRELWGA